MGEGVCVCVCVCGWVVVFTPFVISVSCNLALPTPVGCVCVLGGGGGTEIHSPSPFVNYEGNRQTRLASLERRHTETTKTRRTLRASLSGTLLQTLPDFFSYATEGALFISAQLSTDAVSALRNVRVLI